MDNSCQEYVVKCEDPHILWFLLHVSFCFIDAFCIPYGDGFDSIQELFFIEHPEDALIGNTMVYYDDNPTFHEYVTENFKPVFDALDFCDDFYDVKLAAFHTMEDGLRYKYTLLTNQFYADLSPYRPAGRRRLKKKTKKSKKESNKEAATEPVLEKVVCGYNHVKRELDEYVPM